MAEETEKLAEVIKRFYVVKIIDVSNDCPKDFNKYVCVPNSWIQSRKGRDILVKYYIRDLLETRRRVKYEETFIPDWPLYAASIEHATDCYKEANQYSTILHNRSLIQGLFRDNHSTSIAKNAQEMEQSTTVNSQNQETLRSTSENATLANQISHNFSNKLSILKKIDDPIFNAGFFIELKSMLDYANYISKKTAAISREHRKNCCTLKGMMQLVRDFNHKYSDDPFDIDLNNSKENSKAKSPIMHTKLTIKRQKSDDSYRVIETEKENTSANGDAKTNEGENGNANLTSPKEYNKSTRSTLRHRKVGPGIVALIRHSKIYIEKEKLLQCQAAKDSEELAYILLPAIFTDEALKTCDLLDKGDKNKVNRQPVLDPHARKHILRFMAQHAAENNWQKCKIISMLAIVRRALNNYKQEH